MVEIREFYVEGSKNSNFIRDLLKTHFSGNVWFEGYLETDHHGFAHGYDTAQIATRFDLTGRERDQLRREGMEINDEYPFLSAMGVVVLSSVLHDCGRFDDKGKCPPEQNPVHPEVGADRAELFCQQIGLEDEIYHIRHAIERHDYQSESTTPNFQSPETMIGKMVQAADQSLWFNPDVAIERTNGYSSGIGKPFFDPALTIEQRLNWQSSDSSSVDSMTVLLRQIFGSRGRQRFGIIDARRLVDRNQPRLIGKIIEEAREREIEIEVRDLIKEYGDSYRNF